MTTHLFNVNLPKWPQLIIVGKDVLVEQAKDIIFRTDPFLTDVSEYAGGNERHFNEMYRREAGLSDLAVEEKRENGSTFTNYDWEKWQALRNAIGFISTGYVNNDWASCSFIGGPHGWCSPEGKIHFTNNVGKWPSVEDIQSDFNEIAQAFTFVELTATLYDQEEFSEEVSSPLVSFTLKDGICEVVEPIDLRDKVPQKSFEEHISGLMGSLSGARSYGMPRELGLPSDWYDEFAKKVKETIYKL